MKIDQQTRRQIIRNVTLSLFIYALPVLLMFLSFYISGKRPCEQRRAAVTSVINQKQPSYGSE
ncbi:hypothetical protein [Mucilaginibacter sp. HD30]